jgi:hypothetical protein
MDMVRPLADKDRDIFLRQNTSPRVNHKRQSSMSHGLFSWDQSCVFSVTPRSLMIQDLGNGSQGLIEAGPGCLWSLLARTKAGAEASRLTYDVGL